MLAGTEKGPAADLSTNLELDTCGLRPADRSTGLGFDRPPASCMPDRMTLGPRTHAWTRLRPRAGDTHLWYIARGL